MKAREIEVSDDERLMCEALEALHYCTADFLPEPEVVQSACPKGVASRAVLSRFKQRLIIAKRLGYLEWVQRGSTKLICLSPAGVAVQERLRLKRKEDT